MESDLTAHRGVWNQNDLLRTLYGRWYRKMVDLASPVPGKRLEIGGGIGNFKDYDPDCLSTDIFPYPWLDARSDAQELPFRDASVSNIFLFDVLHHIPSPTRFVEEAERVLTPGGRVILMEPYISPFSNVVYSRFHPEDHDLSTDPFSLSDQSSADPLDGDQAIPTIMFWKRRAEFESRFPSFRIEHSERLAYLAYPLSGGFRRKPLLPAAFLKRVDALEEHFGFLSSMLAFRCLTVLIKSPSPHVPNSVPQSFTAPNRFVAAAVAAPPWHSPTAGTT